MVYASIDIGTNSVLLLIAEPHDNELISLKQEARISRLGEGVDKNGALSPQAIERTFAVLRDYASICREYRADQIFAVGTAAMRAADNADSFIKQVQENLGISVEIISDRREAELTFKASAASFGKEIVLMDIGGGSTEFVTDNEMVSLKLGVVSLAEKYLKSDPSSDDEINSVCNHIRNLLLSRIPNQILTSKKERFVATAGTPTTLASIHARIDPYRPEKVHGLELSMSDIDAVIKDLKTSTLEDRRKIKGLQKGREDVILPGALLLREAMSLLGYDRVTVSDRGVRWGLLYEKIM